jgi:glycosyltransferase involved in cell wall biosynthesis
MQKKILYISQCFPYPLDGGGKIKTFNTINTLSKYFKVYSIFVSERRASKEGLKHFSKMGVITKVFVTKMMAENIKKNYFKLFWNYIQLRPHFVYQYRYKPAFGYIKNVIKQWSPDIIHIDHVNSSQFLPSKMWFRFNLNYNPTLILENHNINHLIFKTRYKVTKKIIRKIYLTIEGYLNYLYGLINYRRFDHVYCISNAEKKYLKKYCKHVSTQPLVYALDKVSTKTTNKKTFDIIFVGYLQWPPNEIAIKWFINRIFPLISLKLPGTKFHIIGKDNPNLNIFNNCNNVIFHGYKKNINIFLKYSKVFVLPFKTGAGIRIKCLTALQNGIPIVSTKMGIDGINLHDRRECLLAENEDDFANSVIKLLIDQNLRNKMSKQQKEYFYKNHNINQNNLFIKKYLQVCKIK